MSEHWIDKQGDVWTLGDDGLMHTPETRPFPREHVERKWGPLRLMPAPAAAACGVTFRHDWHGYLDDDGRTRVCDGTPRPTPDPATPTRAGLPADRQETS